VDQRSGASGNSPWGRSAARFFRRAAVIEYAKYDSLEFRVLRVDPPPAIPITHPGDAGVQNPVTSRSKGIKEMARVDFLYMGSFRRIENPGRGGRPGAYRRGSGTVT
jgi:hypothetical protein